MAQTKAPSVDRQPASDGRARVERTPGDGQRSPIQPQQRAATLQVPERPKLAPGVRAAGQMQESAFRDPPWLCERDGAGYIQVTELLHRLLEHCNGECSVEDIAARMSDKTGRKVSANNVRELIAKQLIPKGLVTTADGKVPAAAATGATRSPLAVNMKMKMVSPRVLEPMIGALRMLYWPPVLIGVLIIGAVAQAWMYLVHGVGGSVHDALYAPGLMLIALAVIVLSAGFHELGHAAALRYGGGNLRGMGAGIYLVYPAFYTDVSDNYRLPRWSRVRTDLGGFYFNLIFALGIMAAYVATGQEFLLVIVLLINLEILHQLMPFVRLDGYWTLADITGLPDFFSQMGGFIRSVVPISSWKGRKLPELKWWAKAVFAIYILITVPLLLTLLLIMVKGVPRILATAWDSLLQQIAAFSAAQSGADFLGMATAVVQILVLALPTLGLGFTLYTLGRRVAVAVWSWSKPTPGRRALGALGTLAAITSLVFLWAPMLPAQLPLMGGQPGPLYGQVSFVPIRSDERGTIFDAVGVATPMNLPGGGPSREAPAQSKPSPASEPVAEPTTAPTAEPTAAPTPPPATTSTVGPAPVQQIQPTPAPKTTPGTAATSAPKTTPQTAPTSAPAATTEPTPAR
jgi:putative peptide zinc metalloprotease protein